MQGSGSEKTEADFPCRLLFPRFDDTNLIKPGIPGPEDGPKDDACPSKLDHAAA